MPGLVVMTIVVPFADAEEVERRAEIKQLAEPEKWTSRTEAILDELQLARMVRLAPQAETDDGETPPFEIAAAVSEAEVVAGGPGGARRRAVHELYLELLQGDPEETPGTDPDHEADGDEEDRE